MYALRPLVVLLTFFFAAPVRAQDKPAKPADARRAALVKAGYTPVPLYGDARRLGLYVEGKIGNEKSRFDLDTGSNETIVDLKLAKRLKLKLSEELPSIGLDGTFIGHRTYIPGLMIGPYDTRNDWPNVVAKVADLSGSSRVPESVLGMYALDARAAIVDYGARTLYLRPTFETVWPRFEATWKVTSWQEGGVARKLDAKSPPTLAFAGSRLKLTDGGKTREYFIRYRPYDASDYFLLLIDPKQDLNSFPLLVEGGGRVKEKDGSMTLCLLLDPTKGGDIPTEFAAPKGSGHVLLELRRTSPVAKKPAIDPLRNLLLKDGYRAVRMDREANGIRMVSARIGKHDLRMMVDSGTSVTAFDTAGLGKWGAERGRALEANALRGKVKGEEVNIRGLTLGG